MSNWEIVFIDPARIVLTQVGRFIGSLFLVLFILLIGWLISKVIVKMGIAKILKLVKLDDLSRRVELDTLLARGGINYSLSELVAVICYWLAILVTFVVALNAAGLTIAADLLQRITLFVPNIIAAIFVLIIGMFAAVIMRNVVKTAANNAGLFQANLLSKITEVVIMIFAVAMALEQLQIGARIVELSVSIVLAALGLAFALAFGLGCKEIAGKTVAGFLDRLKK